MIFKTGDVVILKADVHTNMSIKGFLNYATEHIKNISQEAKDNDWVVCQYRLNNGKFDFEVFHKDQLELVSTDIDGGSASSLT